MVSPNVITKLSEHFKADAKHLKEKFEFEFHVVAYRKISAFEMKQSFYMWKQRSRGIPRGQNISVRSLYGLDGF